MTFPPAPLKRRFAALLYELLLIGGVTAFAGFIIGALNTLISRNLPALTPILPVSTGLLLVLSWGVYFWLNWQREGQTLAMRVWQIGLNTRTGSRPTAKQLRLRFLWACLFVVFIPLLAYALLHRYAQLPAKTAATAALFWLILPWGFALLNPRRQFLYDYLADTELSDRRVPKKPA